MQVDLAEGRRVRVRPSGETGRIVRVTQAADGRVTYEVAFDAAIEGSAGSGGESGGIYVAEDVEPAE